MYLNMRKRKKKWAYCPIYKAASTSFLYWLLRVEGGVADPKISLIDSARKYYPKVDSFLDGQKVIISLNIYQALWTRIQSFCLN